MYIITNSILFVNIVIILFAVKSVMTNMSIIYYVDYISTACHMDISQLESYFFNFYI